MESSDPLSSKPTPNGTLLKNRPPPPLYRECLKNHAASLGAHALDGCGEFIPSPSSNPSDPSSLTCAACGCHRNFHRRLLLLLHHPPQLLEQQQQQERDDDEGSASQDDQHADDEDLNTAPHMLLALSTGLSAAGPTAAGVGPAIPQKKRARSKFSPEQKERMQELSERLGWRMQKRDEGVIEECCREIGVGKGVFKAWMHNNKHKNNVNAADVDANIANANGSGGDESHAHGHGAAENGSAPLS